MTTLEEALQRHAPWNSEALKSLAYARSCRNREKRAYAIHYAAHLILGVPEPSTDVYDLGYMGAQAVRLALHRIVREES